MLPSPIEAVGTRSRREPQLLMVRRDDVAKIRQHGADVALHLRSGDVILLDAAIARAACDYTALAVDARVVRG